MEYASVSSNGANPLRTVDNIDFNIASYDTANEDDQAESVDSGCVPDLAPETSWLQISSALKYEYSFITSLLQHTSQSRCNTPATSITHKESNTNDSASSTGSRSINPKDIKESPIKSSKQNVTEKKEFITDIEKELPPKSLETNIADKKESLIEENIKYTPNLNVGQKKNLEKEYTRLKRGKIGNLTASQAKTRENKIKKQLVIMGKKKAKTLKKIKKEAKKAYIGSSVGKPVTANVNKIYNNCGKLVYSKFDFSDSVKDKWTENNKPDLNYYVSKVIKEKEKIKSLTSEGKVDQAAGYLGKKLWNNAMKKAQGEKVRDNSQRINKSVERKKQQKKKSQEKWSDRVNSVKKSQDMRQEKKLQNFASRKQKQQQRSKGKKKKGKGSGSRVPGF